MLMLTPYSLFTLAASGVMYQNGGMEQKVVCIPSAFKHGLDEADMTDEEYDALDEELTRVIPKLGPAGSDWLTQRELRYS